MNCQQIIKFCRLEVLDLGTAHSKGYALVQQFMLAMPQFAQELGTGAFKVAQVVGIVDDSAGVSVFVEDAEVRRLRFAAHIHIRPSRQNSSFRFLWRSINSDANLRFCRNANQVLPKNVQPVVVPRKPIT